MAPRRALRTPPRASRTKPRVSYAEPPSDSDLEDEYSDERSLTTEALPVRPPRRSSRDAKIRTPSRKRQRASTLDTARQPTPKKRVQSRHTPVKSKAVQINDTIASDGIIPPWQSLPYHVLLQIFQYASYPLYDEHTFQPLPSGSWLLKVARLCRAFAEPAFTVLYASPPLVPMDKAHKLVDLLKTDPDKLAFKYRQKVESLRIDVGQVAAYSLPGSGHLDLFSFVKDLPRLVDLEFYHQKDMSPYRDLEHTIKWSYPESLFEALEYVDPAADPQRGDKTSVRKLRSWRWSSRLAGKKYPIESIRGMHLKPCFSSLRKIAFVNYQVPPTRKGDENPPEHEKILGAALSVLENLEHLIFESSTLFNAKLLQLLPNSLRALEVVNCSEVTADDFIDFLTTKGSQLRCLILNHNQSLSLSFLPHLGLASPKLEVLRMNLTYFTTLASYHGSEPQYDELLEPGEVPVWPSTLQTIELTQLRKWEAEAAEMFFQSLLDSASILPDLRRMTIQAILNIGWRDRASFRDKWLGSLNRVFKRVCEPPRRLVSVAAGQSNVPRAKTQGEEPFASERKAPFPHSANLSESSRSSSPTTDLKAKDGDTPTRRSTRTSTRQAPTGKYAESSDNSASENEPDIPSQPSRHALMRQSGISRELAILKQTAGIDSPREMQTSNSDSDDVPLAQRRKGKMREAVQGMCEVVDIRIDNLRPRETQATEADFLDDEIPGDADWDGEDVVEEGYAW